MLCEMLVLSSEKDYRIQKVQGRTMKFIIGTKWLLYEKQVGHAQILLFFPPTWTEWIVIKYSLFTLVQEERPGNNSTKIQDQNK